jgi:hypothetical protein
VKDQQTKAILMVGPSERSVHVMRSYPRQASMAMTSTMNEWHTCLDHPYIHKLNTLAKNNLISITDSTLDPCSSCQLGKLSHVHLAAVPHHSTAPFEIIFSDVWGPTPVSSSLGHKYFVIFINDFTRYTWIYFLKYKSEVFHIFLQFKKMIERQFNTKICTFHSYWGGKYQKLHHYFKQTGIQHRIACPYTHE